MSGIRTIIDDTLGVVRISSIRATYKLRIHWVLNIDDMQTTTTGLSTTTATNKVCKSRFFYPTGGIFLLFSDPF